MPLGACALARLEELREREPAAHGQRLEPAHAAT